jgi:hypothetical protein
VILKNDLIHGDRTKHIIAGLPRTKRIVDVGCGIRPCPVFQCEEYVCIEPCAEYVEHLRGFSPHTGKLTIIHAGADALADQPREDTTVVMIDVIEHMERAAGERIRDLVREFEHSVIFTPLGWFPQGGDNPDGWGLNGGEWQKHRSAWQPEDFEGWNLKVWPLWHARKRVGAILATR